MKKVLQQYSPRSQSPRQQYFNNRLGSRISPKNSSRLGEASIAASSVARRAGVLNAPIATSRQNRSKSIREALDNIKQRSISKSKPILRRLLPSAKSTDKFSENVQKLKEKSPAARPLRNITGSFVNNTVGFCKIKPVRDNHTKDTIRLDSMETSSRDLLKSSILQPPQKQPPSQSLVCREFVEP